jgi:hypothetical protein
MKEIANRRFAECDWVLLESDPALFEFVAKKRELDEESFE